MSENLIAGGVVVVGNHDGILATASRGHLSGAPGSPALDEHTIFDLASLTKVVATAPAVMKLLDEGRISLSDPISRWFPEFAEAGREPITVQNLLTHTSGLDDVGFGSTMESAVRKAAAERNCPRPGTHFHYADINFILLGELVHRVSGETLDAFCRQQIYGPLGDQETMFLPPRSLDGAIAATSGYVGGVVQDPNARRLGGVAGHAGLFSSAYDLSRYARLMLNRGTFGEHRVLSEQVVAQMTTPHPCNDGRVLRGLGWDIHSPYSAPRGSYFSPASFGHTGYSGTSIWIDPQQDRFVILLTRRLNYTDVKDFNLLRRNVSSIAAAEFQVPAAAPQIASSAEASPSLEAARASERVVLATYPAVEASTREAEPAVPAPRAQRPHPVKPHFAKAERLLAKSCSTRHFRRVARAEAVKAGHHPRSRRGVARG